MSMCVYIMHVCVLVHMYICMYIYSHSLVRFSHTQEGNSSRFKQLCLYIKRECLSSWKDSDGGQATAYVALFDTGKCNINAAPNDVVATVNSRVASIYIYIYIYTHTHTHISIFCAYIHTHILKVTEIVTRWRLDAFDQITLVFTYIHTYIRKTHTQEITDVVTKLLLDAFGQDDIRVRIATTEPEPDNKTDDLSPQIAKKQKY
jgi:hypothetical protein